jgi:branched-chain amino acid aminotransferase
LRAYDRRPFAVAEHLERLARSAEWARLPLPAPASTLAAEVERASSALAGDAAVRVFLLRGEGPSLREASTHRMISAEPLALGRDLRSGAAVLATAGTFGPHGAAKYMRYLPHLLAQDDARARGAEEALLCDAEGRIVEGATSNVFAVLGGELVTPAEASGILAGITRGLVLRLAAEAGVRVAYRPLELDELERASELFITSSLREIFAIDRVARQSIGGGAPGPVTRRLHEAYRELTLRAG